MKLLPSIARQEYAFGHGRLTVLLGSLLHQVDIDRFLGAPDFRDAKRMLMDVRYLADGAGPDTTSAQTLKAGLKDLKVEAEKMVPAHRRTLLDVLWLSWDVALLGYLLKEKHELTSDVAVRPDTSFTSLPSEALERIVAGEDDDRVPLPLKRAVRDLLARDTFTASDVDDALAKAEAACKLMIARKHGNRAIVDFVRHGIDLTNVRSFLRSADKDEFIANFIDGGFLPRITFTGDRVSFWNALQQSRYDFAMKRARSALEKGEWVALEQAIATVRIHDLRRMWNETLGVGPVFAYVATILEQIDLLRAILIGKQSGLEPQDIKRIVPPLLTASLYA